MNKTRRNHASYPTTVSNSVSTGSPGRMPGQQRDRFSAARKIFRRQFWCGLAIAGLLPLFAHAETIEIGIGTQNTTTNTVTGGVVIKELKLLEKHLPKTGKYQGVDYKIEWQNFTSGPPVTNGMMANRIHIGMMGDYPLMVNGATGQETKNETQLVDRKSTRLNSSH